MLGNQRIIIANEQYKVLFIVEHSNFNKDNLHHDLALLKLERPVTNVNSTGLSTSMTEKNSMFGLLVVEIRVMVKLVSTAKLQH